MSFGLELEEFWQLTPREYQALVDFARIRDKSSWQRAAMIAHTIYSMQRTKRMKKLKLEHFMPRENKQAQPANRMLEFARSMVSKGIGRIITGSND